MTLNRASSTVLVTALPYGHASLPADQIAPVQDLLELGHSARRAGDHERALVWFKQLVSVDAANIRARLESATELRTLGRLDEADQLCHEVLAEKPEQPQALMSLGYTARRRRDAVAEALTYFQRASVAVPRDPWPWLEAATELRDLGRLDEAEAACRIVLNSVPVAGDAPAGHAPTRWRALMELGHCARGRGNRTEALARFMDATATAQSDPSPRLEVATELRELGRIDEAEAQYHGVLVEHPQEYWAVIGLGLVARSRGQCDEARACFERAKAIDPAQASAWLELAVDLRDAGDFVEALDVLWSVLAHDPANWYAWLAVGHTERQAGHHQAALEAFRRACDCRPNHTDALVEMALQKRYLGRPRSARALLTQALELAPDHVPALEQLGELVRQSNDPEQAFALCQRAAEIQPANVWAHLGISQALIDLGEIDNAKITLEAVEHTLGQRPEISAKRVQLLRETGDMPAAYALARQAVTAAPRHFELWVQHCLAERLAGNESAMEACLQNPPARTMEQRARVHHLRGQNAEERWQFDKATSHYLQALELNPHDAWIHSDLARVQLLMLNVEGAREHLRAQAGLEAPMAAIQRRSSNISWTQLGQILDEFTLDGDALNELVAVRDLPPDQRIQPLTSLVRRGPGYTPAAMALLIAMRQAGRFTSPMRPADHAPIPRRIVQYWNEADVPVDVLSLMQTWRDAHPDHEFLLFNADSAQNFLCEHYAENVVSAYRFAREPAQKADLFRLAFLFAKGGFYADADDRCLKSLSSIVPTYANLFVYQEDFGTLGNNLIGAVPQHPVIGCALDLAVEAVDRGDRDILWLSTGPGLLTRAFAQILANSPLVWSAWLNQIVVLDRLRLRRAVAVHCLVNYKKTRRHWSQPVFRSRQRPTIR
jgi:tetratricopeptide (TPR) repeat protein